MIVNAIKNTPNMGKLADSDTTMTSFEDGLTVQGGGEGGTTTP